MKYLRIANYQELLNQITLYSQLKHEYGTKDVQIVLDYVERILRTSVRAIKQLPIDKELARKEPNDLAKIRRLRARGPRLLWHTLDKNLYAEKVEGALLARMAGCTLGAIVEGSQVNQMEEWAKEIGDKFPPVDYWTQARAPLLRRYGTSQCIEYTRGGMNGVPVDDDIAYTLLGLLIVEEFGPDFTTEDVAKAWLTYLPFACTAEHIALMNLKAGVPARKAAEKDNPYCQWIGADIRSDPWGYMAPGLPEKAAEMAYRDAFLSHRRNGIHGEMFFSAAQSAAFAVDNPVDALKIGLTEIPKDCKLAADVRWALRVGNRIKNYRDARRAVDERFKGMHPVHTNNNACLTIFGLMIGGTDVTRVLSETVAMGMDNDCTTATAGSIVGAIVGKKGVPKHWYKRFNNTVHSYLINRKKFKITALIKRFTRQAERVFDACDY